MKMTVKVIPPPIIPPPPSKEFVLHLDAEEMRMLVEICGVVGGNGPIRAFVNEIYEKGCKNLGYNYVTEGRRYIQKGTLQPALDILHPTL